MNKWKTIKSLKYENKYLKAQNEYLVHKWATEAIKNNHEKLKNKLIQIIGLWAIIAIAFLVSPIIPITSFCSTTGLCPYYSVWNPILTRINAVLSERTNWNGIIDIDNLWLVIIGFWMAVAVIFMIHEVYKKDKEIKKL